MTLNPKPSRLLRDLIVSESGGGLMLIAASALALFAANGPWASGYFALLGSSIGGVSALHAVNDGLMTLFFLLVGLEIKRELVEGELSTPRRAALPAIAALGGMAVPALVYLIVQGQGGGAPRGWAIPAATDIAFTLGVMALLGKRVPASLKLFVTALAIIDDLGAVAIIALFYSHGLSPAWLAIAAGIVALLAWMNRRGVTALWLYSAVGMLLWVAVVQSGVHATLAGVVLAMTIPLRAPGKPLHRLEHTLQPWVAYAVVPLFGLANAGVALGGMGWQTLAAPVTLGVAAGLFLGKQAGVFGAAWLAIRLNLGERPAGATAAQLYGAALLCGIGFTMSLFIGLLAFADPTRQAEVKLGVLAGSLLSAGGGMIVLRLAARSGSGRT